MKIIRKIWPLVLVLILSFWSIKPLLMEGFFPIHDNTQVVRIQQMAQALKDGQFPVRWVGELGYGYGYPIYNFYAPLPYYLGAFFNLLGFNALTATKLMMIVGILLSGVFMYLLSREFFGIWGGVISALFYVYAPYHALDIYVRGAVGEFWAIAFLPLLFWGLYRVYQRKSFIIASLGFVGVILSHNLTAVMAIPFIFLAAMIIILLSKDKKLFLIHNSLFIILSLGLSAFYWLPALYEKNLTKVNEMIIQTKPWEHLAYWDQFWNSPWGFAGSAPGRLDGMSFMVGELHLLLSTLSLVVAVGFYKRYKKQSLAILVSNFYFLVSILFSSQSSAFIWQNLRFLDVLQYPWRFLIFAILATSFMAGSVILWFKKNTKLAYVSIGLMILILLIFNIKYFQPQTSFPTKAADYLSEENIKWFTSKISDEYLPVNFPVPQNKNEVAWQKVIILEGNGEVKDLVSKSHRISFKVSAATKVEILVNTAYFPGWKVWLNGEEADFTLDNGKIKFSIPGGNHQVLLRFTNTPTRSLANLISLASWIGLVGFVLK